MSDDYRYRIVTAVVLFVRQNAIAIKTKGKCVWIPRSLIHGGDDIKLDAIPSGVDVDGVEHTFRLSEWKAEEIGLS